MIINKQIMNIIIKIKTSIIITIISEINIELC